MQGVLRTGRNSWEPFEGWVFAAIEVVCTLINVALHNVAATSMIYVGRYMIKRMIRRA